MSTTVPPQRLQRWQRPVVKGMGRTAQLLTLGAVLSLMALFTLSGVGMVFGGLALAAVAAFAVWNRPYAGVVALIVVGSFHQLIMLLLFHFTGSMLIVKLAQVWKEGVILVLLVKVIDLAFRRRRAPRVHLLDLGVVFFLVYAALYLAYPSSVAGLTLFSKVMGLRADAFFLLAYFIGRGMPLTGRQVRTLLIVFGAIVAVVAAVGVAQFLAPSQTNAIFEALSYSDFKEQVGDADAQYLVRQNEVMGALIPRAPSVFLSDLGLAFYSLLAVPLMAALYFLSRRPAHRLVANLLLLAALSAAVLSVTRSAILALVPALALLALVSGRPLASVLLGVEAVAVGLPLAARLNLTPELVRGIFSPNESSAQGHVSALELSIEVLRREPFGRGLGTAGQIGQRFLTQGAITNESWYFQIATEIGAIGALLFLALLLGFGIVAFRQYWRVTDYWLRALCLAMGGATIGYGLVSITLHAWENLTVSIIFWFFAGLVVRAHTIAPTARGGS